MAGRSARVATYVSDAGQFCRRYEETLRFWAARQAQLAPRCAAASADGYWAWQ